MEITVSIPYEREGTFRRRKLHFLSYKRESGFNSLRAGRDIQTLSEGPSPFPGAGHVSIPYEREGTFRRNQAQPEEAVEEQGFNSLRAGRDIQTNRDQKTAYNLPGFQFPTSGKGHSD